MFGPSFAREGRQKIMDEKELTQDSHSNDNGKNYPTLELCFSVFIGIVVLGAFIASLTYDFVSARTPIVILTPLLILSAIQIKRAWNAASGDIHITSDLINIFSLKNKEFNGIAGFLGWMIVEIAEADANFFVSSSSY